MLTKNGPHGFVHDALVTVFIFHDCFDWNHDFGKDKLGGSQQNKAEKNQKRYRFVTKKRCLGLLLLLDLDACFFYIWAFDRVTDSAKKLSVHVAQWDKFIE